MREITHSIYYEPNGFLARVRLESSLSFFDRRGLESLIFAMRARDQDTQRLEEQLTILSRAEGLLAEPSVPEIEADQMNAHQVDSDDVWNYDVGSQWYE